MLKDGLVVIDVQYGLSAAHHYKQLLANINQRIDAYHAADHPIIFMQHTDESMPYNGHDWQLDTQLHRAPSDRVILKYHSDSFFQTGLAATLHGLQVQTIEVAGLQTEYCIDTAIRVDHDLGFKAATIHGLNSTFDTPDLSAQQIIAHHEGIWDGSFAEVVRDEIVKL